MGVKLAQLVTSEIRDLFSLARKRVVLDGSYVIISALKKIRPHGQMFVNRWGEPLAPVHVVFYKTLRLLEEGIRPIYVFDGLPPIEKRRNDQRTRIHMQQLWKAYEKAKEVQDREAIRNLFQSTTLGYRKAVLDAIELLKAMGIPAIIAPSEGEAQGAALVKESQADFLFTPDYDALLFGCPTIIRHIDFSKKQIEVILLEIVLKTLNLTLSQLIDLAILIGTDFNDGVPRIGPKRGLALIRKFESLEQIPTLSNLKDLQGIRELFQTPQITHIDSHIRPPNVEMVQRLLLERGFSTRRAQKARNRLLNAYHSHRTTQQHLT